MSSSRSSITQQSSGEIIKQGCLKKLKTNKKKYFVLRADSSEIAACIEYYDSERKFRANQPPKRSITLKTCFNINKRTDTKHKWVIALYTKKDCFCIVFEGEEEMEEWLKSLLELQLGESLPEGEPVKPVYGHIWNVSVLRKELGGKKNILGHHLLCLTESSLSLFKEDDLDRYEPIEFSLQKIRRCGHVDTFFYMELGQCTVTGPGNLWMQTEDGNIAENMHTTIMNACKSCSKKDSSLQPKSRVRSDSANEATKRIHTGGSVSANIGSANHQRTYSFPLSPVPPARRASTGTRPVPSANRSVTSHFWLSSCRDRSDSMPSRNRTTSEGGPHFTHLTSAHPRPHSMYNKCDSYSPPINSSPVSPASVTCSTDSAGSSLSMDGDAVDGQWEDSGGGGRYGPSLTPDEPVILEENVDDYGLWPGEDEKLNNYMQMEPSLSLPIQSHHSVFNRKHSPNPSSSGFKSSSPSQGSGMDLCSPLDSSPLDTTGNYLPMSPGESRYLRSVNHHSRDSSLTEDGYVPMAPNDDGYVDMDHGANHNKHGSCGSITSGTPSTDIRFSEYPLDKVSTYISPEEEEITPSERPARAYSVGSRPSPNLNRSELLSSQTCERVRAFSLGSRNVQVTCRMPVSSSHSSMEPCDDMMVLDFSKRARKARKKAGSSERLSVPGGSASTLSSAASSYSTAEGSYTEMSPPRRPFGKSPPKSSPPHLSRVPEGGEYRDPKRVIAPRLIEARIDAFPASPPIKPQLLSGNRDDYLDMSLKRKVSLTEDNNNRTAVVGRPSDDYVEMNYGKGGGGGGVLGGIVGGGGGGGTSEDYVMMSAGGKRRGDRSQPIAIKPKETSPFLGRTPPKSSPPIWKGSREQGIFTFSPDGYKPSPKCHVDATSGEMRICDEEDEDEEEICDGDTEPMERFITGLGTLTIVNQKDELKPSPTSGGSVSPNGRKELHYASLDLVKSGSESEESGRTVRTGAESSSSPSPSLPTDTSPFSYAEIDFAKSTNNPLH